MTHVTIVQVHETHLGQVSNEVRLQNHFPPPGCNSGQLENQSIIQHVETSTEIVKLGDPAMHVASKGCSSSVPEVLYVNVAKLRQNISDQTTAVTSNSQLDLPKIHKPKKLSRRSSIINQNVGVTGGVLMKSDPKCHPIEYSDDESESSLTESESSLSGSDSGLSSTIEVGMSPPPRHSTTITIGDDVSPRGKGILLHVSPKSYRNSSSEDEDELSSTGHHDEVISIEYSNFEVSEDLSEAAVTLEWRVIPPSHAVLRQPAHMEIEGDRGSTPTSFSSAYTVTEHENESTSEDSETSRHNWSSQESDEESHEVLIVNNEYNAKQRSSVSSEEEIEEKERERQNSDEIPNAFNLERNLTQERHIIPTLSDDLVKEAVLSAVPRVLRRLRHSSESSSSSSGEESIVYSYIPCRDQREKEDEELWVANEAADPTGTQTFQGLAPPLLPPPWGWGGSVGRVAAGKVEQQVKRGLVSSEQSQSADTCTSTSSCVASIMCTVAPPHVGDSSAPRRHYSTRQRTAETQIIKFKIIDEEPKYKENWNKLNDSDTKNNSENKDQILSSLSSSKPTKRFSFLVRSNSVKQEGTEQQQRETMVSPSTKGTPGTPHQQHTTDPQKSVTPSDQAILDKLASLNIDSSSSTPAGVTPTMTKTRSRASIYDPPCTRCGEPVYPQERTEPTLRLVFHSSCFKCHHCGVRLTLKTFYRSPLDSRDTRLFCRGHVPALDPGKLDSSRSDHSSSVTSSSSSSSSSGKSSPDCLVSEGHSDNSRTISNNPSMCLQERLEIVKCDTIGLRYF